jgi:hypothetical protein
MSCAPGGSIACGWRITLRKPHRIRSGEILFVAYFASAQINCYRVRDWPIPQRILDPYVEFSRADGGTPTIAAAFSITETEKSTLTALDRLLPAMAPRIDLPRGLLHGKYTAAVSAMEHASVPIDTSRRQRNARQQVCPLPARVL